MGIPYYFYALYKKYANSNLTLNESDVRAMGVNHLFFDYNSLIHPCAQGVLTTCDKDFPTEELETNIINACMDYTRYVISMLKPKTVHVMIDGVAPRAKMNQQRERRYKSVLMKSTEANNKAHWDSNKITPGTKFMDKINDALIILKREMEYLEICNMYVSNSNEHGEGEHKMMKYIETELGQSINANEKICIYGLDADLIMLSLLCKESSRIILLRDNTFNGIGEKTYMYVDISKLSHAIFEEIMYLCKDNAYNIDPHTIFTKKQNIITDYIFVCILLGNDFMHNIPSLVIKDNANNVLLKCYTKVLIKHNFANLVQSAQQINLSMLKDLFYVLSKSEDYFFTNVYNPKTLKENIDMDCFGDKLVFYTEDLVKYGSPGYKQRYYTYYGIQNIDEACFNYVEGLFWVLGYYKQHAHSNWSWYYKFHGVPFISDLYLYLEKHSVTDNFEALRKQVSENIKASLPYTCMQQLFMVLPKQSLLSILDEIDENIARKLRRLLNVNSTCIEKYYPDRLSLDVIQKEYLWQSKIFFNQINERVLVYLGCFEN